MRSASLGLVCMAISWSPAIMGSAWLCIATMALFIQVGLNHTNYHIMTVFRYLVYFVLAVLGSKICIVSRVLRDFIM